MDKKVSHQILIRGARQNNLRNVSVAIPHDAVTVITGVSGSGKSSLAFDTLFAEGQWRYVESLSTYTRMFVERLDRPEVDSITNIRPAIAIEQKNSVRSARSTVGTATEIFDHLRVLFATIGRPICPKCQVEVRADLAEHVVDQLLKRFAGGRAMVLFPIRRQKLSKGPSFVESLLSRGFVRVLVRDRIMSLEDPTQSFKTMPRHLHVVLDRLVLRPDNRSRLMEAVETAYREGDGKCRVDVIDHGSFEYSAEVECKVCGYRWGPLRPISFSFNHPLSACTECKGFGNVLKYDEALVVPAPAKSLAAGAIEPWTKPSTLNWQRQLLRGVERHGVDITRPYNQLTQDQRQLIWEGGKGLKGVKQFFETLEGKRYKLHVRVLLSRYRSPVLCPACGGSRLKADALNVKIHGQNIHDVSQMSVEQLTVWLRDLPLNPKEMEFVGDLLRRLRQKLEFLMHVGLEYLTLLRETRSLSGGEAQRIALANQLGCHLVGTLYVLDEPTIGLHARDTSRLISLFKELADHGNTVVVVEHDPEVITRSDHVVELGPLAGDQGGAIVCAAPFREFLGRQDSLTAAYLRGDSSIPIPHSRRKGNGAHLTIFGAFANNLRSLTVSFPLGMLVCVTGVSGSGKSTLVEQTLYRVAAKSFGVESLQAGPMDSIEGLENVRTVRLINQEPIGKTPRSNPITYLKGYQDIRKLFANTSLASQRGFSASHFSFNSGLGRCRRCQGNGMEKLEMYFFEDLYVTCEDCEGRRFRPEVLNVRWNGFSIDEVLKMTVEEAARIFTDVSPSLERIFGLLQRLGLGYLRLGQPSTNLSGGEAQRLKVAAELVLNSKGRVPRKFCDEPASIKRNPRRRSGSCPNAPVVVGRRSSQTKGVLYILDEPTRGLHASDISKLLDVLGGLVDAGNSVIVVEHHLDVIKAADWVIDLGPEGGVHGGRVVATGIPEDIAKVSESLTGKYLATVLP